MSTAPDTLEQSPQPTPWGSFPPRMRVLYVTTEHRTGSWLAEAFAADSASEMDLEESIGVTAGLAKLRDEAFDVVLLSHEPGDLDALELIEGLRAGGFEDPLIVLGNQSEQELSAVSFEVGADAYLCVHATTTRTLIWTAARAIERHRLIRENRKLIQSERQRLQLEHQEANRLLSQQRALISDLEALRAARQTAASSESITPETTPDALHTTSYALPDRLVSHYRELLRAHVIMGFGNLSGEMSQLAEMLASAGVTGQQTMQLHVQVLEELVRGLGTRSARHVMSRADLLILEVTIHLAEGYRRRFVDQLHPPQQLLLPGWDEQTKDEGRRTKD